MCTAVINLVLLVNYIVPPPSPRYHDRMGIALGGVDVLVEVLELQGRQFVSSPSGGKGAVVVAKRFMNETSVYAYQTMVKVS